MLPVILVVIIIWVLLSGVTTILLCMASSKFSQSEQADNANHQPRIRYKTSKASHLPAGHLQGEAKNA